MKFTGILLVIILEWIVGPILKKEIVNFWERITKPKLKALAKLFIEKFKDSSLSSKVVFYILIIYCVFGFVQTRVEMSPADTILSLYFKEITWATFILLIMTTLGFIYLECARLFINRMLKKIELI